jgi:hypothetical protein
MRQHVGSQGCLAGGITFGLRPGGPREISQPAGLETMLPGTEIDVGKIATDGARQVPVQLRMRIGEDQLDGSATLIDRPNALRERRQMIKTGDIGGVDPAPRAFAPVHDEGDGLRTQHRSGDRRQQHFRIGRLLALERPGVEGLHDLLGINLRRLRETGRSSSGRPPRFGTSGNSIS